MGLSAWLSKKCTRACPRVLTIEYNCIYGALPIAGTHPDEAHKPWQGDNVHGCSLAAIDMVAQEFGWTLALVVQNLDAVLIQSCWQKGLGLG